MVAVYFCVTFLAMLTIGVIISNIMESFLVSQRVEAQSGETRRVALEIAPWFNERNADKLYGHILEQASELDGRILILDNYAVVQADSASAYNGMSLPYHEVRKVLHGTSDGAYGFHRIVRNKTLDSQTGADGGIDRVWAVYYTAPIVNDGIYLGAVLFSTEIQDVHDGITDIIRRITAVFFITVIAMGIITFILSGFLTKPIVELTGVIRRMGTQGFGARVRVKDGSIGEVAELSRAFNRMSEQIEDHDRVRDEFVSNASHELKTPLSAMKVLSESILYENDPDPGVMREFFLDVNSEVDRLTGIIEDLLSLVREERGRAELNISDVRLDELTLRVVKRLMPLSQKKGLKIETHVSPVLLEADSERIEQVVSNLVDNAIKYTDTGKIVVVVKQEGENAVLTVQDTGIGIPKDAQQRLFERFYRVDKARSRGTGGTGLGLAIVERIVSMHNGYIRLKSEPAKGSVFTLYLPMRHTGEVK